MFISITALATIVIIAFMLGMITAFVMMVNAVARMKSK
jgi:hypothetical protein